MGDWYAIIRYLDNESEKKKRHILPVAKVAGFMPTKVTDFSKTKRYKAQYLKKSGRWSTTLYECQILQISDSKDNLQQVLEKTRITIPLVESTDEEVQSEYDYEEVEDDESDEKSQNRKKSQPSKKKKISLEERELAERLKQRKLDKNTPICSGNSPTTRCEEPGVNDSCALKEIVLLKEKLELVTRERDEYQVLNKDLQRALLSRLAKINQRSGATLGSAKYLSREGTREKGPSSNLGTVQKEREEHEEGEQHNVAAEASFPERYCSRVEGSRTEIHVENGVWVSEGTLDYARGRSDEEFVGVMAKAMWGSDVLAERSLTGKPPQGLPNKAPKKAVTPQKLAALRALYIDFIHGKDLRCEDSERRVKNFNRHFTAKLNNAARRFRQRAEVTKPAVPGVQKSAQDQALE